MDSLEINSQKRIIVPCKFVKNVILNVLTVSSAKNYPCFFIIMFDLY